MQLRNVAVPILGACVVTGALAVGMTEKRPSPATRANAGPILAEPSIVEPPLVAPAPASLPGRVAPLRRAAAARTVAVPSAAASLPSVGSGMIAAVDRESGALVMPEREESEGLSIARLQELARAEAEGLVTVRHADGSESIEHEGRFADHSVIRIGPDGVARFACVHGAFAVPLALDPRRPAAPAVEEE